MRKFSKLLISTLLILSVALGLASCEALLNWFGGSESTYELYKAAKQLQDDTQYFSVNIEWSKLGDKKSTSTLKLDYEENAFFYSLSEKKDGVTQTEEITFANGKMYYLDKNGNKFSYTSTPKDAADYVESTVEVALLKPVYECEYPESWFDGIKVSVKGDNKYLLIDVTENMSKHHERPDIFVPDSKCEIHLNNDGSFNCVYFKHILIDGVKSDVTVTFDWTENSNFWEPVDANDYIGKGDFEYDKGHRPGDDNRHPCEKGEHNYLYGECVDCKEKDPNYIPPEPDYSIGLEYTISDDRTYYVVAGVGTCKDTDVVIPNVYNGLPVKEIGWNAFACVRNIISVTIPENIVNIDSNAFWCCYNLESYSVDKNNPNYKSVNGDLYTKDGTVLLEYAIGKADTTFTVPSGVTKIKNSAFQMSAHLESVSIGNDVVEIGSYVFVDCHFLTNVTIGSGVTHIGDDAFRSCYRLSQIIVGVHNNHYSSIDGNLYSKDTKVLIRYAAGKTDSEFCIPNSVTSIAGGAFQSCSSLEAVVIPDGVTSIGSKAFTNCTGLISIVIPSSVESISDDAFWSCDNLTDVYYTGSKENWERIAVGRWSEILSNVTKHYNYVPEE